MSSFSRMFYFTGVIFNVAIATQLLANIEAVQSSAPFYACCESFNPKYCLKDLGELGISLESSNKDLRPKLNSLSQVIGNRLEGGFEWNQYTTGFSPHINNVAIAFHSISNSGDILVSLTRPEGDVEWAIWPTSSGCGAKRTTIFAPELRGREFAFQDINDDRLVAGYFINKDGKQQMVLWSPECGVQFPCNAEGIPLQGVYKGMTSNGTLYGYYLNGSELRPSTWNFARGEVYLCNYRSKVVPEGSINLDELAMTDDGVVYGSYSIDYPEPPQKKIYYSYAWKPITGGFKLIDIGGMRITAVNNNHVLVGELEGSQVVCFPGRSPTTINAVAPKDQNGIWQIDAITGINDSCHLTGIASYEGKQRVFFAEKLRDR